jgi:hypothetical protein
VHGNDTSGVTPFADIYIPGNIIPPNNVKVALNGITEVQSGSSQSVNATVTNPAPSDRQVTKSGLTAGSLIHLIFHYSSNTISISNSSVTVPEFPAGGIVLLLVVSAAAYVMIRYRVLSPASSRIS